MFATLKNKENTQCTIISIEQVENGTNVQRVDIIDDTRKRTTVSYFDNSWDFDTIRSFFFSELNAIIDNGFKLVDIK